MQRHEEPRLRSQQQKATARRGTLDFLVLFLVGAVSFVVGQMLCLPHQEASSPLSEEILPFKKDESRADSRKSKLYDGWLENIYAAAGQVQRPDERIVSFRLFDLSTTLKKVKAPPPFFYPIEETLHSATYIVGNEKNVLDGWMAALRKAQADKTTAANCLDVGSNGGFFSLMSRSAGCRTLAVDAQPWCVCVCVIAV